MRWVRPARLPILIAWLVVVGVLWYLAVHPRLVAPYASNLVSRHLLRIESGGVRVQDFRVRAFEGVDLYGVSVTLPSANGGLTLASADTVAVEFSLREALGAMPRLRRVTVRNPAIYARAGDAPESDEPSREPVARDLGLPYLVIDHLEISDAFLEFSDGRGRLTERIRQLDWRGEVRSGEVLTAVLRGCNVDWETHDSIVTELRGDVLVNQRGVSVRDGSGRLNGSAFRVSGARYWDDNLDLQVSARGVSVDEVEELIDQTIGFNAAGDLDGTFVTHGDTLVFDGVFTGELEGYQVENLTARAAVTDEEVLLTGLGGRLNGATFRGSGRFLIGDIESVAFVLEGDVAGADLSRGLVPGEDDLPPTDGAGRLRIEHTDRPLWTRVSGVLHDGFIATIPFDTCYVDVEATGQGVVFNRVELREAALLALVEGEADTSEIFRGWLSLNSEDLATLPRDWNWPPLAGRANGQGALEGPIDDLRLTGWVSLFDFALPAVAAGYADAAIVVDDVLEDFTVAADIDGRGLNIGGVPLGDYKLQGWASERGAQVDSFRTSYGDTTASLRLRAAFTDTINRILVEDFRVDLEGTPWALRQPLPLGVGDGYFAMSGLDLRSPHGAVTGGGIYDRRDVVSGGLELRGFDLGLLNPFVDTTEPLTGLLSADLLVGGEPDDPVVTLDGDLVAAPFDLARIDSLHVEAVLRGGTVDIGALDLRSEYGRVTALGSVSHPGAGVRDFWPGADLDLELQFEDGNWAFLDQFALPALDRLSGSFDGAVRLAGSTDDPIIRGRLHSAPFHVHWLHLDELDGEVWADSRTLVLGGLRGHKQDLHMTGRIEVPVALDLLSEPVTPMQGPFYMELEIPEGSDLSALAAATNAFGRGSTSGTGHAKVIVSGPLEHPFYQGGGTIRDAAFVIRDLEEIYREASCDFTFSGDEMRVTNIRGREGLRGTFTGEGTLLFRGLELETFDIELDLDRFLVASIPDLAAVVSGEGGRMTGVKVGPDSLLVPKFSGDLEVLKARYTGSFEEKEGAADPRLATVAPDWLADLHLHAQPRVAHIINRDMELDLGGDLDLIRNEEGLYLRGSLDVNKGRLIVFNNDFTVERGRLDFSRELGFDPRLDLDAATSYRLRSQNTGSTLIERIGVHVTGTLAAPVIDFSSDSGYSREAIQRMLLGLDPEASATGDRDRLTATSISAGFNMLEREIARELSVFDTFEIDQIQRQRETGATGLDPLVGVGKYIGSDLYLKYAQGIRQDDRDIMLEYQINQHLLLQSEMRRRIDENQGEASYNLDLKYRFEY